VRRLAEAGVRVSCFIDADPVQVAAAKAVGAQVVELHTGAYCDAVRERSAEAPRMLAALRAAAEQAHGLGLEVHAGHGIDYETVKPVAAIAELMELNIGHFLIGEAIFVGLTPAIQRMRALMDEARATSVLEVAQGMQR
jgi:pyridoxine 5-phosphate synthase